MVPLTFVNEIFPNAMFAAVNEITEELEQPPPLVLELLRPENVIGPAVTWAFTVAAAPKISQKELDGAEVDIR
jgi:hypothetical protein